MRIVGTLCDELAQRLGEVCLSGPTASRELRRLRAETTRLDGANTRARRAPAQVAFNKSTVTRTLTQASPSKSKWLSPLRAAANGPDCEGYFCRVLLG